MQVAVPPHHAQAMQAGLAFVSGFLEAFGLIALSGLFIGHVTANIALLGVDIATGTPGARIKVVALPVFMATVAAVRVCLPRLQYPLGLLGRSLIRRFLALEICLLLGFAAAGLTFGPFGSGFAWSTALTGSLGVATLAVQNAGMRLVWRSRPSTTVMSLNLTQLALDAVMLIREPTDDMRSRFALLGATLLGFLIGAALGAISFVQAGFLACAFPIVVLLILLVTMTSTAHVGHEA